MHDPGARPCHRPDEFDQIDIVDLLEAGDIVGAGRLALQASGDYGDEITGEQRLPQISSRARDWKYGRAVHESFEPADVLAVKPAEHQRRSKDDLFQATGRYQAFLGFLGLCIEVLRSRVDHRRTDVDEVRRTGGDGVEHARR